MPQNGTRMLKEAGTRLIWQKMFLKNLQVKQLGKLKFQMVSFSLQNSKILSFKYHAILFIL